MIKKIFSNQIFLFLITGVFAAACNFLSRIIFNNWFNYSTSIILAYLIGMITAFLLNKKIVFKETSQQLHISILYFTIINLFGIFQTWLVSLVVNSYLSPYFVTKSYSEMFAHAVGLSFPFFFSYLGHKKFSFKKKL